MVQTAVLWMLISVSASSYNYGTLTVVAKFKDQAQCEFVQKNIPSSAVFSKCVQAEIVVN